MIFSRINIQEARLSMTFFIISFLPVVISGEGENKDKVSPLQINNQVSIGANDTVSDNNQNITSTIDHEYDERIPKEVDHFFLLIMSIIIFFMQCGFAFMEAGAVRSKNTVNILIKNWLDMCIGALVYWAVGFGLTFGNSPPFLSPFMGSSYFFFYKMPAYKLSKWFFQFVFAATAATLVSGSLAERCNFIAYLVYSIMITGFIYPIIAHWTWHKEGWLRINGFHDFAGSAVVHLTGAVCALVGCVLMGPRHGRFDKTDGQPIAMPGHSVPLSALGGLILVFGFFACNGTKRGSITQPGDGIAVATAVVNTAFGTAAAGLSTLMFSKTGIVPGTGKNYSFLITMNGSLTGTIALCAGCDVYPAWASVIVGGLSGPLFVFFNYILIRCGIDDPLDAIPVHGAGGVFGTIAVYVFKEDGLITGGFLAKEGNENLNYPFHALNGLLWNIIGLVAIIAWTGVTCFIMFSILAKLKMLRVETEQEFKGMDLLKHGESAYPADAWVEQQYMKEDAIDNGLINGEKLDGEKRESKSRDGLPPHMSFSRAASYNNPHEMFPSTAKLFSGFNSVAANVANTRNILLKPIEGSSTELESLTEQGSGNPINKSEPQIVGNLSRGESNLQIKGLSSNGLDGDLVLHKEDNNQSRTNVDPLTKSSTIVTQLSSVQEEESDNGINDDGIVIEEEHLDTNDSTATRRKTTSITLTTAENAANKANNQIHNQELPLTTIPPLSTEAMKSEQNGKSNLSMPMVIAAANQARCLPKVPTISVPDSQSDAMIPLETRNNGQPNNEGTNRSTGGVKCSLLQLAVAVASPRKSSPKPTPNDGIIQRF